jgi:hypothetical protein
MKRTITSLPRACRIHVSRTAVLQQFVAMWG